MSRLDEPENTSDLQLVYGGKRRMHSLTSSESAHDLEQVTTRDLKSLVANCRHKEDMLWMLEELSSKDINIVGSRDKVYITAYLIEIFEMLCGSPSEVEEITIMRLRYFPRTCGLRLKIAKLLLGDNHPIFSGEI